MEEKGYFCSVQFFVMTRITLEVDQLKDLQLIIELAKRLKIRYQAEIDPDTVSEEEAQRRINFASKQKGKLKKFREGYTPSKHDWYQQCAS